MRSIQASCVIHTCVGNKLLPYNVRDAWRRPRAKLSHKLWVMPRPRHKWSLLSCCKRSSFNGTWAFSCTLWSNATTNTRARAPIQASHVGPSLCCVIRSIATVLKQLLWCSARVITHLMGSPRSLYSGVRCNMLTHWCKHNWQINMRPVRIELTTLGLWDLRAANCSIAAWTPTHIYIYIYIYI